MTFPNAAIHSEHNNTFITDPWPSDYFTSGAAASDKEFDIELVILEIMLPDSINRSTSLDQVVIQVTGSKIASELRNCAASLHV